jgi:hypothetical protein
MKKISIKWSCCVLTLAAVALAPAAGAGDLTAFELAKEGNRHVGEDSKDKILQIRSEKSIGSLTPNLWYVVYYDPDAPLMAVEVKFGGGKKMHVKRPARILERAIKADRILPADKLKIDSDRALEIAKSEPILNHLTLKATELTLERMAPHNDLPVWKVRLWAAKLKRPNDSADIGEIWLAAEDGKVVRNDVRPNRVD